MNASRNPSPRSPLARFILGFIGFYIVLLLPWPRVDSAYDFWFHKIGRAVFVENSGPRMVWFESAADANHPYAMKICIASRETFKSDGGGLVHGINMDSINFAWHPTALILALFLATPVSWRRRLRGLALTLAVFHLFLWAGLAFAIWYNSSNVGLVAFTHWQTEAGAALVQAFLIGVTFLIPVLSWMVFVLRQPEFLGGMQKPSAVAVTRN